MQNQMKEEQLKLDVRRTCSHLTSGVVGLVRRIVTLVVLNQVWGFLEICARSVFLCTCAQLTIKHEPFNKQLGVKMSEHRFNAEI
jgi:hypothetical protein